VYMDKSDKLQYILCTISALNHELTKQS
jgi:hypothetical protein